MIISHKHKYIFIELPRTGTTAISTELKKNYDGESIFEKHTPFSFFQKKHPDLAKEYFVFSCIRNPLDRTVSLYFHLDKTLESNQRRLGLENSILRKQKLLFAKYYFTKRYNYVDKQKENFSEYFLKFYKYPYVDWSILAHEKFDFIIRFENLNEDFKKALKHIGIKPVRDLPQINKTAGRSINFLKYYDDKTIIRAKKVFSIYLKQLGYKFPKEWDEYNYEVSKSDHLKFKVKTSLMKSFWRLAGR